MAATARISAKGQLVIPREIRRMLNLKEGDEVRFVGDPAEGRIVLERVPSRAERRTEWLESALGSYEAEHAWGAIDGEDFRDED